MRNLTIALLLALVFVGSALVHAADDAPSQLKAQADSLSALLRDSYAKEFGRKYYLSSRGSGPTVAVVLYGFEGFALGNNWSQYMAVFSVLSGAEPGQFRPGYYSLLDVVKIGAKGWRAADLGKLELTYDTKSHEANIRIPVKENQPEDALNFPTKQSQVQFRIKPMQGERVRVESK